MGPASGSPRAETDLRIRPLRADELSVADAVRRLAFGTFLGLPDPMSFRGDASPVRTRYLADPTGSFAAELGGELVGTNFVVDWGSVGFFGPLSVRPDFWDRGIAQRLVEVVLDAFARRGRDTSVSSRSPTARSTSRSTRSSASGPASPPPSWPNRWGRPTPRWSGPPIRSCRPHGSGNAWRNVESWPTPCTAGSIWALR